MTSLSKVKESNFELRPDFEVVTVDPYNPAELAKINQAQPAVDKVTDQLSGKLTPDEIQRLKNDPKLQSLLAENKMSLQQYAANLEAKLPKGLSLKQALANGIGLKDVDRDLDHIKDKIKEKKESFAPSKVLTALKYTKSASKFVDVDQFRSLQLKAKEHGIPFPDDLTESGLAMAGIEGLLNLGKGSEVWSLIEGTPLGDKYKNFVVTEGIEMAAKNGSYTAVKDIIQNYPNDIPMPLRAKCVMLIMENFRIGDENLESGYRAASKNVADHLDAIYPNWQLLLVGSSTYYNDHANWIGANEGALTLMKYHADNLNPSDLNNDGFDSKYLNVAATIQVDRRFRRESLQTLIGKAQPTIVLK